MTKAWHAWPFCVARDRPHAGKGSIIMKMIGKDEQLIFPLSRSLLEGPQRRILGPIFKLSYRSRRSISMSSIPGSQALMAEHTCKPHERTKTGGSRSFHRPIRRMDSIEALYGVTSSQLSTTVSRSSDWMLNKVKIQLRTEMRLFSVLKQSPPSVSDG